MIKSCKSLFFRGMFKECMVVPDHSLEAVPYKIGSMIFQGQVEEAKVLYHVKFSSSTQLELEEYKLATFFIILGLVRVSEYKEAEEAIRKLKKIKVHTDSLVTLQAEAFLDYYYGRTHLSFEKAQKVYHQALAQENVYFQILSVDLMGHAFIQKGEVFQAIDYLKKALEHANEIKNVALINTLELTIRKFELRFQSLDKSLDFLLQETDHYSHLDLSLEIISQCIVRSDFDKAQQILNQYGPQIYIKKNRRQMAKFQLRYSYFHLVQGQPMQALNLIEATEKYLVVGVDNEILLQVYGLKFDIYQYLNADESIIKSIAHTILELSKKTQSIKNDIFLYKRGLTKKLPPLRSSNDLIGEVITALKSNKESARKLIIKHKLNLFLYDIYNVRFTTECLLIDLKNGQGIRFCQNLGAHLFELPSELFVTLLRRLAQNSHWDKQSILESVWGIKQYNPIHHDPLIYQAIARLRKITLIDWVEFNENGLEFKRPITFVETPSLARHDHPQKMSEKKSKALVTISDSLNYRQLSLMNVLKIGDFIQPGTYRKKYSIATMTAYRDLQDLTDLGYLVKRGNARSTSYWRVK